MEKLFNLLFYAWMIAALGVLIWGLWYSLRECK